MEETWIHLSEASSSAESLPVHFRGRHHHHRAMSPSLLHGPRPPPVPAAVGDEIDPRYGVEKRLVPTGPNPLHN
ncbi:hypothetical protein Cni_G08372 [Canna indica]|uniref:Uncharacterized protein n=1 Tax=Canna indica TaxID=4628 RepID=A0AAQ3Q5Q1_9LILI|nr:hypothetical protein Cni_G08372 [Canna indica]